MIRLKIRILLLIILSICACQRNKIPTIYTERTYPPLVDQDGNTYQTVTIGNQVWMAENLRVTHYRNGDPIPLVTDPDEWDNLVTGAYCAYENKESNAEIYGYLYNWYAVNDSRQITPVGWFVPREEDWRILIDYLGGSDVAGGKLKEAGYSFWPEPNEGASNESGFSALPGGLRHNYGQFEHLGKGALFWSRTEDGTDAWICVLSNYFSGINMSCSDKKQGYSIRFVRWR